MTILVTGAAGFIGFHVAKALLERGETVVGVDNFNDYYDPQLKEARIGELDRWTRSGAFTLHRLDFADADALRDAVGETRMDAILHLGAQAGVRYSLLNPEAYLRSNLLGHGHLLELARRHDVRHFVYASSSSVYGNSAQLPLSVDQRVDHPVSLYAATKKSNELMSEAYAHLYRIPSTGLRFFTVYGRWGRPDMAVWDFTRRILAGEPIPVFNHGRMRRDFTHISDIVAGVLSALDRPPADDEAAKPGGSRSPHSVYNLGNSRSEELGRLIELLEAACGRPALRDMQPMQPGDVVETYAEIGASQRDLAYEPATRIDEGVPDFVRWFRSYHGL
jgi:UDP-glucuronate 4-epimerase